MLPSYHPSRRPAGRGLPAARLLLTMLQPLAVLHPLALLQPLCSTPYYAPPLTLLHPLTRSTGCLPSPTLSILSRRAWPSAIVPTGGASRRRRALTL